MTDKARPIVWPLEPFFAIDDWPEGEILLLSPIPIEESACPRLRHLRIWEDRDFLRCYAEEHVRKNRAELIKNVGIASASSAADTPPETPPTPAPPESN
jgi:hypothetical protein